MSSYRREITLADGSRMIGGPCEEDGGFAVRTSAHPDWTSTRQDDGQPYWMNWQPYEKGAGWVFQRYLSPEETRAQRLLADEYWQSPECPWQRGRPARPNPSSCTDAEWAAWCEEIDPRNGRGS